jgi:hypothetical protein
MLIQTLEYIYFIQTTETVQGSVKRKGRKKKEKKRQNFFFQKITSINIERTKRKEKEKGGWRPVDGSFVRAVDKF